MEIPNDQTLVFEDGVPYLRQAKQVVDIKHHQPISFGLSVRKGLAKGFSLETGLTYTLLSSDAKLAGEDQQIEQKLHYVGIPLRANWNFFDKNSSLSTSPVEVWWRNVFMESSVPRKKR